MGWTVTGGAMTSARIRERMKARGVTVADLGEALNQKPMRVGQRIQDVHGHVRDWPLVRLLLRRRLLRTDELTFTPPEPRGRPAAQVIFEKDYRPSGLFANQALYIALSIKLPDGISGSDVLPAALDPSNWSKTARERDEVVGVRILHEDREVRTYGLDGVETPVDRLRPRYHAAPPNPLA